MISQTDVEICFNINLFDVEICFPTAGSRDDQRQRYSGLLCHASLGQTGYVKWRIMINMNVLFISSTLSVCHRETQGMENHSAVTHVKGINAAEGTLECQVF